MANKCRSTITKDLFVTTSKVYPPDKGKIMSNENPYVLEEEINLNKNEEIKNMEANNGQITKDQECIEKSSISKYAEDY